MKYENLLNKVSKKSVKLVEFMIRSSFFNHFYEALKNRDVNDPDFQQITEANIKDVYTEFYDLFREDVNDTTILKAMFMMIITHDVTYQMYDRKFFCCGIDGYGEHGVIYLNIEIPDRYQEFIKYTYKIDVPRCLKFLVRYSNPNMTEEQKGEFKDLCSRFLK